MIIKCADDKTSQINLLRSLRAHPDATVPIKRKIEKELENILAGERGEKDAP